MSYIKSKTSDFFIEILTMDGLSLDRKLGLCQMYLDEVHLLSKKKNNYLIYKTEYEPASMLLLAIRQLKTEMGPLALQAHTNVLKNNSNVPSFINQKGQDIYFEDLCYGKIQKSTKGAVFDYFVEFKDLIQNLFIVKTFVRNGENVQVFYPKYTNKHGEAL